ncbi:MAG: Oligopeptide-binding protein AppA [Chlamydiae bacterium]|nr:Oligopeptide-binding protein AppA [Chlamydiota bacterium]
MNKEPIGLYIFRFILGFALFAIAAMIYWSTSLIEDDINRIEQNVNDLKSDLLNIRIEIDRVRDDLIDRVGTPRTQETKVPKKKSEYSNLLTEDPFYIKTLPEMLGSSFRPSGDYRQATAGKPKNLHPFGNWSQVNEWIGLCSITLSNMHFGIYETLGPGAAERIEQRSNPKTGNPEFWVFLRDDLYWKPLKASYFSKDFRLSPWFTQLHQVTAHDFKFWFDAMMNPFMQQAGAVALRTYYGDIESFEVVDDQTFVVRWKVVDWNGEKKTRYAAKLLTGGLRPLASFVYKYFPNGEKIVQNDSDPETYRKDSVWAQNFTEHWAKNVIVSCGPWVFSGWNERRILFDRNSRFYDRYAALMEKRTTTFKANPDSAWQDFKVGLVETVVLQPKQLVEWDNFQKSNLYASQKEKGDLIERLDFMARSYSYIGWNEATPYFNSAKVRRAMTMAIDRNRIIKNILNGMGVEITGPFFIGSDAYDKSIKPWQYDPVAAERLLDEEGWYDTDDDGIRDKEVDGKVIPFSFSLTFYVKNPTTKAICEYVATALKEIGVDCQLNGVDLADLSALFDEKGFDALALGWGLGTPPEDPRQLWYSAGAKEKGSSNAIGFSNKKADKIIDALEFESDREKRIALYHRFHQIMHEEAPYTFLYTPKTVYLYRNNVQNVFIPADRQDLIPGANVAQPQSSIFWIKEK